MRKYTTHFERCKVRKEVERNREFFSKERNAIERRRMLSEKASKELILKRSTIAHSSDNAALSQETNCRMRARAEADPENLHQRQKRRIAEQDSPDVARGIALPKAAEFL